MKKTTGLFYLITGLVASIILVIIYIAYLLLTTSQVPESDVAFDPASGITVIDPAVSMPDFTLTDQHSQPIHLRDFSGKPILLTFGFTHCPDVCPLTLQEMREIHTDLGEFGDALHYVFISVDGERDTPEALAEYFVTMRIDDFAVGLTGSPETVRELGEDYRLFFAHEQPDEQGNYAVEHTAGLFLLDSENHWIRRYAFGANRALISRDLLDLVQK